MILGFRSRAKPVGGSDFHVHSRVEHRGIPHACYVTCGVPLDRLDAISRREPRRLYETFSSLFWALRALPRGYKPSAASYTHVGLASAEVKVARARSHPIAGGFTIHVERSRACFNEELPM